LKNYKIQADPRVKLDLQEAIEFLKSRRKGLDAKFLADYKSSLKTLKTNPFFEVRYDGIRCLPLEIFKYMIHYSIDEGNNTILINAVISNYLDPDDSWL
jgi:mRNA-degrading endonuclease RelE of RelBE toxin-antitoxin system